MTFKVQFEANMTVTINGRSHITITYGANYIRSKPWVVPRGDNVAAPPNGSWWVDHHRGKFRIFMKCWRCRNIMVLEPYYVVHPQGFLDPCVKCSECYDENFRFLARWKPIKIFTASGDWKLRDLLVKPPLLAVVYPDRMEES